MSIKTKTESQKNFLAQDPSLETKKTFYYQVIPSIKAPLFKSFLYQSSLHLKEGQRVKVPFGSRKITGFILEKIKKPSSVDVPLSKIKSILEVDESQPPILPESLDWLKWMSDYYHYPLGSILNLNFLSPSFKKKKQTQKTDTLQSVSSKLETLKAKSLNPITQDPARLNTTSLNLKVQNQKDLNSTNSSLNNINLRQKKQSSESFNNTTSLNIKTQDPERSNPTSLNPRTQTDSNPTSLNPETQTDLNLEKLNLETLNSQTEFSIPEESFLKLTPEQEKCVKAIPIDKSFKVHLIHGVTGSGKTEVYARLIAKALKQGGQALVLLPEIFLTPQIVKRLSYVFPDQIALWHSQITKAQKKKEAQKLLESSKNLLVGTRSALFCPLPKLAVILIDEEHDSSFKQEDSLRYQARDSALVLAQKKKIPVVLGSATPDFSSYKKALDSSYQLHELKHRALNQKLPKVSVLDLKTERKKSPYFWLSDFLLERMEQTLKEGNQVALFLNRRGQAKAVVCGNCGHLLKCSNCDISLTLHQKDHLICHYCSYLEPKPNRCSECGSDHWIEKGLGTQKVEEGMKKLFPQYKTLRADRDSISSQKELLNFIEKVENQEIQILIGTQMLAKGLNFPSLRLVGLLLADMDFNFPDFRAEERGFQTLLQMAGRAGRTGLGEVLLQSFQPDHPNFQFLKSHDYKSFFFKSIQSRETWGYPPFSKLCLLKIDSLKEKEGQAFSEELANKTRKLSEILMGEQLNKNPANQKLITKYKPTSKNLPSQKEQPQNPALQRPIKRKNSSIIQVLGPSAAPLMKIKNRYRFQILIKTKNHQTMSRLLKQLIETTPKKSFIQLKIDRDPYSML